MAIELRVRPRTQRSPMSCWWASMAMILEYYGTHYTYPWQYRSEFARPVGDRPGSQPRMHYPSIDEAMATDSTLRSASQMMYMEPSEWYDHGLPRNRRAFERLTQITDFDGLGDRPAFGSWTADDVESRLRRFGPYAFFGFWSGYPHVILTIGLTGTATNPQVVTIDPDRGFATPETLESFNHRMRSATAEFAFNGLNPIYLPQSQPIRDVVLQ